MNSVKGQTIEVSPGNVYLLRAFELVRSRVRGAVLRRQSNDPDPEDRFRGLYISDEQALQLLEHRPPLVENIETQTEEQAALEQLGTDLEASGEVVRLRRLARSFDLTPLDVDILLVALGPDIDPRLEQAYGYLHDDVTRRRASTGLALELCSRSLVDAAARARLGHTGPLILHRLIIIEDTDRPFLTRSLRVPDAVTSHLLGDDTGDRTVEAFMTSAVSDTALETSAMERGIRSGMELFYVRDRVGAAALSYAASGASAAGLSTLALDLARLGPEDDLQALASAAGRQARLTNSALVVSPLEVLVERGPTAVRTFAEIGGATVLIGSQTWDPAWSRVPPLVLDPPDISSSLAPDLPFRLTPEQSTLARRAAAQQALAENVEISTGHLAAGARAQNAGGLERLSLRISPSRGWDDLVLPDDVLDQLEELVSRVRHRDHVLNGWGMRRGASRGQGVTALFAGDSGTGKTLAAEVVAGALELDLYVIDLSTVVDKYIGETEKNLDRIFREADRVNGVLLFDEADAIFGKRSEVQDARDRYANVEVAYLLQRMERFDGVAILTTNLRANIDEAFLRRLDTLVDFPLPDVDMRFQLWESHLPERIPRDGSVDLEFLAKQFDLAGGNIRNIALTAAFLAAADGGSLSMSALIRSTAREYRKLGRLCVPTEFGQYYDLIA